MSDQVVFILLILVSIIGILLVPRWLTLRAVPEVLAVFRQAGAVGVDNALTIDQLGFGKKNFIAKSLSTRDYKPRALNALVSVGVVEFDEDGKLYLVEEKLAATKWAHL